MIAFTMTSCFDSNRAVKSYHPAIPSTSLMDSQSDNVAWCLRGKGRDHGRA
jgi:hypothetical protein